MAESGQIVFEIIDDTRNVLTEKSNLSFYAVGLGRLEFVTM